MWPSQIYNILEHDVSDANVSDFRGVYILDAGNKGAQCMLSRYFHETLCTTVFKAATGVYKLNDLGRVWNSVW